MTSKLMTDERLLWQGRPRWGAVARDVLHLGWLAFYVALLLIWHAADNRAAGLGPVDTMLMGIPLAVLCLLVLAGLAGFARIIARTTTYTLTTERCILDYGVALTARLSLPLRRVAAVSIKMHGDGSGDILIEMKPGARMSFLKLWPHARPWRRRPAQPMLRGVADAARVAAMLSAATAEVCAGTLHALPAATAAKASPKRSAAPSGAILSAGD